MEKTSNSAVPIRILVYTSRATKKYSRALYSKILLDASQVNSSLGVTGLLLASKSNFFQILEGPSTGIGRAMDRIQASNLHENITILRDTEENSRLFPDWAMGGASENSLERWGQVLQKRILSGGKLLPVQLNALELAIHFCATHTAD